MPNLPIYLDNNASTPVDSRVLETMLPYFTEHFGNAASTGHAFGRKAREAVERSRASIAKAIGAAKAEEIVFTSGATESDGLALRGLAGRYRDKGNHIITVTTEHKAVLDTCRRLEREGFEVTYLGVERDGLIDLNRLTDEITAKTIVVSVMAANNEIGVIQNISSIGWLCKEEGVLFHTDATQAVGKIPFCVEEMNVDLASFTAHKIYGPKGVGALYVRGSSPHVELEAQIDGGGHEGGCRSGTLNVTGIIGLCKAVELCLEEIDTEARRLIHLRDRLKNGIQQEVGGVSLNGHETARLPGHLNLSFEGIDGGNLLGTMPEIALSTTSACSTGARTASHVLTALGLDGDRAFSAIRFGIGRFNTEEEIDYTIGRIADAVAKQRRFR